MAYSYTLDEDIANYPYAIIDGGTQEDMTQQIFDDIFDDRQDILFYIMRGNSVSYEEVTDPLEVGAYTGIELVVVETYASLRPTIHNEPSILYQTLDTLKYFRFRDTEFNIPIQAVQTTPEITSRWYSVQGFNTLLTTFDVYIDGTGAAELADTAFLGAAIRNSKHDFTSFNTNNLAVTPDLYSLLPTGMSFMDHPLRHVDASVVNNTAYKYRVVVETIDGRVFPIYVGSIEHQTPERGKLPAQITEDDLLNPINPETTLNELDFQSGPANRHLRVTLSDDPVEYSQFIINRDKNKRSGCLI